MGGSSTRPSGAMWSRNGPNSSLIQNVPSGTRTNDSGSRSKPVRMRAAGSEPHGAGVAGNTLNEKSGNRVPLA